MNKHITAMLVGIGWLLYAHGQKSSQMSNTINLPKKGIEEIAKEKNIALPDLPWHMINIWWTLKDEVLDFKRFDIDVTIDRDIPRDYNLYISPIYTDLNNAQLYAGIQTNTGGWKNKKDHTSVSIGKAGIFSRWSEGQKTPIGLDYVDLYDNSICESAGYEGEFCSVRRPYQWTKGVYTLSLIKQETINFLNEPHTWVQYQIQNKNTSEAFNIGRLLFRGETLKMRKSLAAFIEIYGGAGKNLPEVLVTFGYPIINGRILNMENVYSYYPTKSGPISPNVSRVSVSGNNIDVFISPDNLNPSDDNNMKWLILDNME